MPDEKQESAIAFLEAAVAYYARFGVAIARVLTDHGSCYRSKAFAKACRDLGLKHVRTRPYTPKTTDVIDKILFDKSALFSCRARTTAWRRAGSEVRALPRSFYRRTSFAASVRAFLGPRGFQPATKRA